MVIKFRGDFITNDSHCKLFMRLNTLYSITSVTINRGANDDFYIS